VTNLTANKCFGLVNLDGSELEGSTATERKGESLGFRSQELEALICTRHTVGPSNAISYFMNIILQHYNSLRSYPNPSPPSLSLFLSFSLSPNFLLSAILSSNVAHCPAWKANSSSGSQEISRILWNQKCYYHLHNNV
jgi:hypothetical protein